MMVPGGCHSQGCHGYLLGSLAAPFSFTRHLVHTHLLLMGLARVTYHILTSLCAYKGGFLFSQASWSEVNRNGLHSLKESLDLEEDSIIL